MFALPEAFKPPVLVLVVPRRVTKTIKEWNTFIITLQIFLFRRGVSLGDIDP